MSDLDVTVLVWFASVRQLASDAVESFISGILAPDEQKRAQSFRFDSDRWSFLSGHLLTLKLLSHVAGRRAEEFVFGKGEFGRPLIEQPDELKRLSFNRSRTREIVACAVSSYGEVGLDIEDTRRDLEIEGIARQFFSADEAGAISRCGDGQRATEFFRYWTLKEAYVKACGKGMATPFGDFSILLFDDQSPQIVLPGKSCHSAANWHFVENTIEPYHRAAIALNGRGIDCVTVEWCDVTETLKSGFMTE